MTDAIEPMELGVNRLAALASRWKAVDRRRCDHSGQQARRASEHDGVFERDLVGLIDLAHAASQSIDSTQVPDGTVLRCIVRRRHVPWTFSGIQPQRTRSVETGVTAIRHGVARFLSQTRAGL